jgi:membrane associated rhomboid family serine protease
MARGRLGEILTFGRRLPAAVGGLLAALALLSLANALAGPGGGIGGLAALRPAEVAEGELWRLVTWTLVETDALGLIFGGVVLWWLGRDLARAWGARRFLVTWFGFSAASGVGAALLALLFPSRLGAVWLGPWAVLDALVMAWGLLYPERRILFYFALPVSGRQLVWITPAGTLLLAAFSGLRAFVPHLVAQVLVVLWFRGLSPRGAWQRLRIWMGERRMRRRASHLKVVRKNGEEPPRWLN